MAGGEGERGVLVLVVAVAVIVAVAAFSMMGGYGWRGMMGPGMMPFGGMGLGWPILWAAIFILIVIAGVYFVLTGLRREEKPSHSVEVLKERYAKGEITSEEFRKIKKELG